MISDMFDVVRKLILTDVLNQVDRIEFSAMGGASKRTTVCALVLRNGYVVTGADTVNLANENFSVGLGQAYAFKDALDEVWRLETYRLSFCRMERRPYHSLPSETRQADEGYMRMLLEQASTGKV